MTQLTTISTQAEALLGTPIQVHEKGYVTLLDYMGTDATIVKAARTSTGGGLKSVEEDIRLLRYLYTNRHTSPFEQVVLQFEMKLPIFVARQLVRHRTARLNEESARYHPLADELFVPPAKSTEQGAYVLVRGQDRKNKQSSDGQVAIPASLFQKWNRLAAEAHEVYQQLLHLGVSREISRVHLPLSTYTKWTWQMDLHNLMHFLRLRLDPHAQEEIQDYARVIYWLAKAVAPETMHLFRETLPGNDWVGEAPAVFLAAHHA